MFTLNSSNKHHQTSPYMLTSCTVYRAQCCYAMFMSILWQVTLGPGPHCCAVTLLSVAATLVGCSGLISYRYSWH